MKGIHLTKTSWLLIIVLVVAATGAIYLFAQWEVQSASLTCKRCHVELYATWQASKEHPPSLASCRQCHSGSPMAPSIPPGFSGKSEQTNAHCLACHQETTEQVQLQRKLIKISHRRHIDEGIGCVECHQTISHGTPLFQTNRPSKEVCYRCHILQIDGSENDRSCNMCHYIILSTPPAQS